MGLPRSARGIVAAIFVPLGLFCVAVPIWMLTLPGARDIFDDTRAALGGGREEGAPIASKVDCTVDPRASSSGRATNMARYDCAIDLGEELGPAPAAPLQQSGGAVTTEQIADYVASLDAYAAKAQARANASNRVKRKLTSDRSGELPAVRLLSAEGDPSRLGLVWGAGELAGRWAWWLFINGLFLGMGVGMLVAARMVWRRV